MEGEGAVTPAKAYIFDFDGTIGTIPVDWDGVRKKLKEVTRSQVEFKPVFPTIAEVVSKDPKLLRPVLDAIDGFEWAAVPSARLYEGSYELLSRLSREAKVSLVTMQGERACSALLERFDISQFIMRRFVREDSMDRAQQLGLAISSMKVPRESTVFVGDRLNDLNAAKKVGVRFVLIRTHGEDPEEQDVPVFHSIVEFASTMV